MMKFVPFVETIFTEGSRLALLALNRFLGRRNKEVTDDASQEFLVFCVELLGHQSTLQSLL